MLRSILVGSHDPQCLYVWHHLLGWSSRTVLLINNNSLLLQCCRIRSANSTVKTDHARCRKKARWGRLFLFLSMSIALSLALVRFSLSLCHCCITSLTTSAVSTLCGMPRPRGVKHPVSQIHRRNLFIGPGNDTFVPGGHRRQLAFNTHKHTTPAELYKSIFLFLA